MAHFCRVPLIVLVLATASLGAPPPPAAPKPAPAWVLKDVDGKAVSSDQFKGKVLVIDFWATWCAPCRKEIPGYVDLQNKYARDGLIIVGVSTDAAGPSVVKKFTGKYGVTYQIVMSDTAVEAAFGGIDGVPTTFIIDRDGMIRDRKAGFLPTAEFEKLLLPFLNKGQEGPAITP